MMRSSSSILKEMVKRLKEAEDEPLLPLVEEYVLARRKAKKRLDRHTIDLTPRPRPPGRLSPSSLCGCARAATFRFVGVPGADKTDWQTELIFENGDWFHHKWQVLFQDMEIVLGRDRFRVVGIELPMQIPELYVSGSLDVHIRIYDEKRKKWVDYIVDIKSINMWGFAKVMENGAPLPSHEQQVTGYAHGLRVKRGLLFYENKNDNRLLAFVFKVNPAVVKEIEDWCEDVIYHLERETVPPEDPECQGGTFLYDKCPYSKYCHGKKTDEQVVKITYKSKKRPWPGLKKAWKRGNSVSDVWLGKSKDV